MRLVGTLIRTEGPTFNNKFGIKQDDKDYLFIYYFFKKRTKS
jgi:hypothetical protein